MKTIANTDQAAYWNSAAGQKWVTFQQGIDTVLDAAGTRLLEHAGLRTGDRVVDIGCGTGAMSMAVAAAVGPGGHVSGLDISRTMLDHAERRRAEAGLDQISYRHADAQVEDLSAVQADRIVSRFGVMFFGDPVAAFANIRTALHPGGRLFFVAWAVIDRNPWFRVPRDAAVERLGRPEARPPRAPGPLAFAEIDYVLGILEGAGFEDISGIEEEVGLTHPGGVEAAAQLASNIGPAARIAKEFDATEQDVAAIGLAVRAAFERYATADGVRIPARLNFFEAAAPGG